MFFFSNWIGSGEMVVLKEFELSVNIESISFQTKVEHVDLWLAITKSYFKNDNFEVYAEKKVNKELCTQFRAKSKSNLQIYIVNFFSSGRVVINAKDFRKELLEIHIPKLEELYGITFDIKGATQLIQTTSESEPDHPNNNQQDNIRNGQDISNITQNKNHQQNNTLEKNQISDNNKHNEQQEKNQPFSNDTCNLNDDHKTTTENTDNELYEIPTNIKNVSSKHEDFKREIVTQQSKAQKDFNNKIEKEQIKITEEVNELKETFAREIEKTCSELKSYYDNKEESMKLEIRNLQTQIEHLKNEKLK